MIILTLLSFSDKCLYIQIKRYIEIVFRIILFHASTDIFIYLASVFDVKINDNVKIYGICFVVIIKTVYLYDTGSLTPKIAESLYWLYFFDKF